jgi:hypothetical protein
LHLCAFARKKIARQAANSLRRKKTKTFASLRLCEKKIAHQAAKLLKRKKNKNLCVSVPLREKK